MAIINKNDKNKTMKTFSLTCKTLALFLLATTSLFAADAVNFNANAVTKALYRDMAVHFLDSVPTISSNTSYGYTGQLSIVHFSSPVNVYCLQVSMMTPD